MQTLTEALEDRDRREAVIVDAAHLLDLEVRGKSGLSGFAVKTGYRTVKALRPGIIEEAIRHLLPEFAPVVDPHYRSARKEGDLHGYFGRHADVIAEDLLGITDARAARATNGVMKRAYNSLRPQAHRHTSQAMPRLAQLIERHVDRDAP